MMTLFILRLSLHHIGCLVLPSFLYRHPMDAKTADPHDMSKDVAMNEFSGYIEQRPISESYLDKLRYKQIYENVYDTHVSTTTSVLSTLSISIGKRSNVARTKYISKEHWNTLKSTTKDIKTGISW
ncbi:hypothetical protein BX616_003226 [Lobosporangium transversale]|nr:hypothetical protein BX616_003226 [Lobosporangium transversale]